MERKKEKKQSKRAEGAPHCFSGGGKKNTFAHIGGKKTCTYAKRKNWVRWPRNHFSPISGKEGDFKRARQGRIPSAEKKKKKNAFPEVHMDD